jgi:NADH-quinone oxidoreductase subunit N
MLSGVVVGSQLGIQATVLYLAAYLAMNLTAFAVVAACEHSGPGGDDISVISGLGRSQPWLAWPMTIAMLSLAGIPGTVGFIGKFQLIHALVNGDYTWLAIVLVIGSMLSLGYYLRVIAAMWMRGAEEPTAVPAHAGAYAPIAGGSPEADGEPVSGAAAAAGVPASRSAWPVSDAAVPKPELVFVAVVFAAASIFFGIFPQPLFTLVAHAGHAISGIF